jgi:hypothetical protein
MDHSETRRLELPMQLRLAPVGSVDETTRTVDVTWSTGAGVARFDWWTGERYTEELAMDAGSIRMTRLQTGAPVLAAHNQYDLGAVIGVVERASIERGQGIATVRFASGDECADMAWSKVRQGILRNVSVGYIVHRYQKTEATDGTPAVWRAIDWEPCEVSFVAVPADAGAQVRAAVPPEVLAKVRTFPCEFITTTTPAAAGSTTPTRKESHMTDQVTQGGNPAAEHHAENEAPQQIAERAAQAERERIGDIQRRCRDAGMTEAFAAALVADGRSVDAACRAIVDEVAKLKAAPAIVGTRATIVEDGRVKLRQLVSAAIVHRMDPRAQLPEGAGEFRYMSFVRLAEEVLGHEGVHVRGLSRMQISERALHSTSDFPNILADAFNKRLRQSYVENQPSYTVWARRAPNAPDFKTINVTTLSSAPDLQKVLEGGEIKSGSMSDGKETYQVFTYGRIVGISRQALVNDDLSAFDRIPRLLGNAARRLENRTVYGVLTANAALSDTGALFNVTAVTTAGGHANFATGTGSVLGTGSLKSGRAAMRVQKGLAAEELNVAPAYLIVPAALEQDAYQLTSNLYTPTKPSDVNEFRIGGRTALAPVVEAVLDATSTTAWYIAADSTQIDTIEYCFLDGSDGLYLENQIGFDVDGMRIKARLDFAAAAIDFRGLYSGKGS